MEINELIKKADCLSAKIKKNYKENKKSIEDFRNSSIILLSLETSIKGKYCNNDATFKIEKVEVMAIPVTNEKMDTSIKCGVEIILKLFMKTESPEKVWGKVFDIINFDDEVSEIKDIEFPEKSLLLEKDAYQKLKLTLFNGLDPLGLGYLI